MHLATITPAILSLVLLVTLAVSGGAQQAPTGDKPARDSVVAQALPGALSKLLPDTLAGVKATTELKQISGDGLVNFVADKAPIYQEYFVGAAVSREYAGARVDVFETRNQFAALGLFQSIGGASKTNAGSEVGSGSAQLDDGILFWKANFLARVSGQNSNSSRGTHALYSSLARAVANAIASSNAAVTRPPLFDSLPSSLPGANLVLNSQRYFLGPESLKGYLPRGSEMFQFVGDTEAVAAQYAKVEASNTAVGPGHTPDSHAAKSTGVAATVPTDSPVTLVIVECHTPEFATDELARVTSYVGSLSESEREQIVFKRTGNYIIAAVNAGDREFAEGLVNSVEYPYTVKWLRNPLWPTNDPFQAQKAAEMLLSTFGLLGLILMTVLAGGTIFGASVFLKRRKRQQEVFSDAGGMLRLEIDPFLLGLPPKRDE